MPPYRPQWEWGEHVPPHLAVTPKPMQTPRPPVYVYGWRQQSIDFAAKHGHSIILSQLESQSRIGEKVASYRASLEAAGRSPSEVDIAVVRDVWVHEDADTARSQVERVLEGAFRKANEDGSLADAEGRSFSDSDLSYEALAGDRFLIGDPRNVVDQIRTLQADTGINHLICRIPYPGVSTPQVYDFINTFEQYVHPMLHV
jgi:alkanesulfonate monooxygenase SsuD/methylene tetrahydromethanopterin reductase-like flavin-dependent oxidoreductase (luciferase family)